MLRHRRYRTTAGYAHLAEAHLVEVAEKVGTSISGSPQPFRSSVALPYIRRFASLDAAIPWLCLHGVSTGQMRQAVAALVGEQAARGLSANVVSRLKCRWAEEWS